MDPALGSPTLTVLTTHGPLLAKRVTRKGTVGYDNARRFDVRPVAVDTLDELRDLLGTLAGNPQSALILETPDPAVPNPKGYRRQRYFDPMRHWLALDIDAAEAPLGMDPTGDDAVDFVLESLPEALRGVDCLPQFTASAGLKGNLIRMRVWFRLDAPMATSRLLLWARAHNAQPGALQIDAKLYSAVQLHYTADPLFEGVQNPFAGCSRLVPMRKAPSARVSVAALEAEIEAYEATAALSRENGSTCLSVALAGTWKAPACGWTGNAEDYLQDKPSGMGLHDAVNRLVWEVAPQLGADPGKDKLEALASGIREAALSALSAGRLTGRSRDYILAETTRDAVSRSYRGAVARGAALRTPESAATGAEAALRDARRAAAGKPRVRGYAPVEWLHHAVWLMLPRLGPLTPEALLAMAEARTGIKPLPATREMVQRRWREHRQTYRRDHRLESPHFEVQQAECLEDVEIELGTVVAVKAGHGTGKTQILGAKALSEAWAGGAVIVTYRQTLEASIAGRLGTGSYRHRGYAFKAACGVDGLSSMVIDSGAHRAELQEALRHADVILIDEAEQTLRHLAGEHTRKRLPWLLPVLTEAFGQKHKTIILLDAGLDQRTILGWAAFAPGKPIHVYEKPTEPRGVLNLHRETGAKDTRATVLAGALEALERGIRPVVAMDTQKGAVALAEALTERGYRVGLVTGRRQDEQTKRAFASAPNTYPQEQGWDALIYSPAIAAGVSLESGYFGMVLGLYTGVVSPADFLQQLFRVRTVTEYTVAVVSRGSPAPLPERDRGAALESLTGEELDDVSRLLLRIDTANARDLQGFGIKFVAAAEDAGLRIERIGGDADLEPLALELRQITESIRERAVEDVLSARVLDPGKADRLESRRRAGETLSAPDALALDRFHCGALLALEEPGALAGADVRFVQQHKNTKEIIMVYALTVALMLDPGREIPASFNDPDGRPLVLRRYRVPKAAVFVDLLRGLGVDPATGAGIWKLSVAAEVLARIAEDHRDTLVTMGLRPARWGSRVAETVRGLLARIALRVASSGPRRDRGYQITSESWRRMMTYATRTGVLALAEGRGSPFPDDSTFVYDEENDMLIDPLPGWVREGFGRAGLVVADWRWIDETFGVSRATAYRRRDELAGIAAAGVRWFRAEIDNGRTLTGVTDHADLDRLGQDLTRTLGKGLGGFGWTNPPKTVSKVVTWDMNVYTRMAQTTTFETPPTPATERPAQQPELATFPVNAPRALEHAPTPPPVAPRASTRIQNSRGCLLWRWGDPELISALLKTGALTPTAPIATHGRRLPTITSEVHA